MSEKNFKNRDEWKVIINSIKDTSFQNLIYDLLKALGFINIKQRGGGSDGGRDLEAYYTYIRPNGDEFVVKCWIQCKKQANGVSFGQIYQDIIRCSNQKVDEYYILSNYDTTPDCKDEIERGSGSWYCKIIDWTGLKLQDILFNHPDICKYYFPDEEVPPIADIKKPNDVIRQSSEIGKQFGVKLEFKTEKPIDLNNPTIVAENLKEALLKIQNIDLNVKALIYQKISMYFFGLEKTEDALMFLDKSLDITPKNVEALLNKGYILERIDDIEESSKCYDEILTFDKNNKFALNNKSSNLRRIGQFADALNFANRAIEVDTNFINAIANKCLSLKGLKKSQEAITYLNSINELVEKSTMLKSIKVDLSIEILDLKEAFRLNEEILSENPDNIDAINFKGVIYERNSKYQYSDKYLVMAIEYFEKVIEKNDKYPLGWSNKVATLINFQKLNEAEEIIDLAYALFPRNPYVINKKGVVLLINSKPKEAQKYFEKALKLMFDEEFLYNKAQSQLEQNHFKEAIETADKLLKYNPEKSECWIIKGIALRGLHQIKKSSTCMRKAEKYMRKPISLLEE
jgi:tetratricopeptide (TPR) repeat protein